jgi:hypothetical protein
MSKIKVLITKKVYETCECGYGKYKRIGTPSIGMKVVEFDTRLDAETFKSKSDEKQSKSLWWLSEEVDVEVLN